MKIRFQVLPLLSLAGVGASLLSGCNSASTPATSNTTSASTPAAPGATSAPDTPTPAPTAVDNTPVPVRKPPAGMGNAIGRVMFDGKGAADIQVRLCGDISIMGGCDGKTYQTKTNKDGFYVLDKVVPGDYALAVSIFDTDRFIYPTSGIMSAAKYKIEKDQSLSVRTVNLYKTNMQIIAPKIGASVNTGKPTLTWKAYPNATQYKVRVKTKGRGDSIVDTNTSDPKLVVDQQLFNGDYEWGIEAYNAEDTKIAETANDAVFKVTGQAGSNTVDLVNPKENAVVSGTGLTLQWKANPAADSYKIYLKGVKASDALLSFELVKGNSYKMPNPLPADQYFWSVDAYKGADKIAGSSLVPFKAQ